MSEEVKAPVPWNKVQDLAGCDPIDIAMDFTNGRINASELIDRIANYAECAYKVGARAVSPSVDAPLKGEWRHNNGFIFNGTLRVLRADFDTNPADEFVAEVMGWIVEKLNAHMRRRGKHHGR